MSKINFDFDNNVRVVLEMDFPMPGISWDGYSVRRRISDAAQKELREAGMPAEGLLLAAENFSRNAVHSIRHSRYETTALANLQEMLEARVARKVKRNQEGEITAFSFDAPMMVFAEMAGADVRMHVRTSVRKNCAVIMAGLNGQRLRAASIFKDKSEAGANIRVKDAVVAAVSDGNHWRLVRICRRNSKFIVQELADGDMKTPASKAGKFKDVVLAAIKSANGVLDRFCEFKGNPVDTTKKAACK